MRIARHQQEAGLALAMVLVIMAIGLVIAVGIVMIGMSSMGRSKDAVNSAIAKGPTAAGVEAYRQALNAGDIGEITNFQFDYNALVRFVSSPGRPAKCSSANDLLCLVPNSQTTYTQVDQHIPVTARYSVRRKAASGSSYHFWQIVAVVPPRYGVTEQSATGVRPVSPGGRVVIYVRGWIGDQNGIDGATSRTTVVRADLRAPRFSDYQILADGKIRLGDGATINGKVHSNGVSQSFMDLLQPQVAQIMLDGAVCTATARFSTRSGTLDTTNADPSCQNPEYDFTKNGAGTGEQVNLQRAAETATDLFTRYCNAPPPANLQVLCFSEHPTSPYVHQTRPLDTEPVSGLKHYGVLMKASTEQVSVGGAGWFSTRNSAQGHQPADTQSYGTVLLFDGSVRIIGHLGPDSRLTVVAHGTSAGQAASIWMYGEPGWAPSWWNPIGSSGDATSSFGAIADGDIYAQESTACPMVARGAFIAIGGMLSLDPMYRTGTPGDTPCDPPYAGTVGFTLQGSISGHLPPFLAQSDANGKLIAGFAARSYTWDPHLYDNPPPLFAQTAPWQTAGSAESVPANLECLMKDPTDVTRIVGVRDSADCR